MRLKAWRWVGLLLVAVVLSVAGGLGPMGAPLAGSARAQGTLPGGSLTPPRPDRPLARVKVGIIGTTSDVTFYAAEEKGWFEWLRVEPEYERFDSGGRMVAALATSQVDVGIGAPSVGLYNAVARGVDVKMVADRASSRGELHSFMTFARKDLLASGGLRDFADLRGKRIAFAARGTTAEVLAAKALELGGLGLDDAEFVELPYPDIAAAMSTGQVDVGIAPEPTGSLAAERGVAELWKGAGDIVPGHTGSTMMYTAQFIQQRPDVARDFMVAFLLGVRYYNDAFVKRDPATLGDALDMIQRRLGLRDPELLQRMRPSAMNPDGALDVAALNIDYQWFRQYGGLTADVNLDQVVDNSYAAYAVSVLGPYR